MILPFKMLVCILMIINEAITVTVTGITVTFADMLWAPKV